MIRRTTIMVMAGLVFSSCVTSSGDPSKDSTVDEPPKISGPSRLETIMAEKESRTDIAEAGDLPWINLLPDSRDSDTLFEKGPIRVDLVKELYRVGAGLPFGKAYYTFAYRFYFKNRDLAWLEKHGLDLVETAYLYGDFRSDKFGEMHLNKKDPERYNLHGSSHTVHRYIVPLADKFGALGLAANGSLLRLSYTPTPVDSNNDRVVNASVKGGPASLAIDGHYKTLIFVDADAGGKANIALIEDWNGTISGAYAVFSPHGDVFRNIGKHMVDQMVERPATLNFDIFKRRAIPEDKPFIPRQ